MNVNVVNSKSDYKEVSRGLGECKFCGYKHVFGKSNCPAVNKNCASCGAQGHFKNKCPNKGNGTKQKSRQVRYAQHRPVSEDENDTSDEEHERLVGHLQVMKIKKPGDICSIKNEHKCVSDDNMITLELPRDLPVKFQMDTGAEVSVLPKYVFDKLKVKPEVQPTRTYLVAFTGTKIKPFGKCSILCVHNTMKYMLNFFIVDAEFCPLLSKNACKLLGVIKFVNEVKPPSLLTKSNEAESVILNYPDDFDGLGCLDGEVKLEIDKDVCPVAHPPRKIPVALRERLREELNDMEKNGVIIRKTNPTDWVNSIVIIDKGTKLRVCIDPERSQQSAKETALSTTYYRGSVYKISRF